MNTKFARSIVKDNSLDIEIKGRTNGIIKVNSTNESDLNTFKELLNGMGFDLTFTIFPTNHYYITTKKGN